MGKVPEDKRPLLQNAINFEETSFSERPIIEGANLYWSNLNVKILETKATSFREKYFGSNSKKEYKQILNNVTGMAEAGKLLAIMGSSGAGKTTLLNVLTSRNLSALDVQGTVMLDGQKVSKWKLRGMSAFVQQHDMFVGTMTVREHLTFMALLRMGSSYSEWERNCRVEEVITKMGLVDCADSVIGIPNMSKGISGGEQKRLAFASEILTCPKILFCDEPTSGLDAFMAGHVIAALRALTESGVTVVITIHQPSSQVFTLFHNVCLMEFGQIIYLGSTEQATLLFEQFGFPCPSFYNPADHLIRTLAVIDKDRANSLKTFATIRDGFLKSEQGKAMLAIGRNTVSVISHSGSINGDHKSFFAQGYPATFFDQFVALTWRAWITVVRDPILLRVRFFQILITGLITGLAYFGTPVTPETIISINGILFNFVRNLNLWQFQCVPVITAEIPIVLRENTNGIYRTSAYFIGKNIAELPQYVVMPVVYNAIVYFMSGLVPDVWRFLFASLVCVLMTNVSISISYAVATVFGDTAVAMTVLPVFVIPLFAFGGFFIQVDSIPSYFQWLSALSYFKYSYEALAINQWDAISVIEGCTNSTEAMTYAICPKTGSEVLESIDFASANKWPDMLVLLAMIIIIRLISYIALLARSYKNQ